jgi:hypothetical protein
MAKPRKPWGQLKDKTRQDKLKYFGEQGLTPAQVRGRYNAGTLGSQAGARRHVTKSGMPVPEHGVKDVVKSPGKYEGSGYRPRKAVSLTAPQENELRIRVTQRIRALLEGSPRGFNAESIQENVWKMTAEQLIAGIGATESDLREWAAPQPRRGDAPIMGPFFHMMAWDGKAKRTRLYTVNPWWYHGDYHSAGE